MIPLIQLFRCPEHQCIVLAGRQCVSCAEERKVFAETGKRVSVGALNGERWATAKNKVIHGEVRIALD